MQASARETSAMPETERLLLRDWREDDLAPFAALNADPVVMEHFVRTADPSRRATRPPGRSSPTSTSGATGSGRSR